MKCPKCGGLQYCPCATCRERHGESVVWIWADNGNDISCGHCGYTMGCDAWEEEAYDQYKQQEAT